MVSESVQTERDHVKIAEWIHRRVTLRRLEHTAPRPATSDKEKDHLLERRRRFVSILCDSISPIFIAHPRFEFSPVIYWARKISFMVHY